MIDDQTRIAALHILRYLLDHPAAADTVEGVHFMWIGPESAYLSLDVTQAALELLLEQGLVACVPIGSRLLWRARRNSAALG
ncbi:hypothetical protein LFL96_32355 [Paraburkholderia sp. D15]|uniref:hypothetical protein n=1 Tax=Paraburkholderia sp. D15 TaxID=2880218 RepID=UPI0024793F7F|nr:hypothetical protein [Paraburkholderia sp. D15]WGS52867.1 hypothetical protein LFL96_32355 [Paraburkholderia sp. D15]WKF61712.1 hypothetical protein HUO10_006244 [Paraburkholderia busanensis]